MPTEWFVRKVSKTKTDPNKKHFEREVYTERGIKLSNLLRFKRFYYSRAQTLLEEIGNWLALQEPPEEGDRTVKTGLTIFQYIKDEDE